VTSLGSGAFGDPLGGGEAQISTITLPYKFAGSAGLFGIPGDADITVNFDDVSEGLLANTNFVAGISEEVTFDSSVVDQAIADEAQARADADVLLQADVDQNEADSDAADANLQNQIDDLQTYIDSAVAQARADGVTAGIQSVTSDPQSYQLYNESSIMEMNVTNPTLSMLNESEQAQVEFTLETSTDLEDWNIEERIQRTVQATGDKFFVRIKSGAPYVTPNVLVFNHPSYGEILTDQSGNVLYGFSIDSVGGDPIYIGAAWPLAPQIADPEPDAGVTAALTSGTFSNASGSWLKVNNRPVYTYASDSEPNQASGHGLGFVWFTIKPDGTLNQ
jgi:predicted lipoprotein with Yx(FWY)xxD motif